MPRARTVSLRQLDELLKLMEGNTELANGRTMGGAVGQQQSQKFWASVANALNRIPGGTVRGPDQWKTYWHDMKYRARKRAAEAAAACPARPRSLSAVDARVVLVAGTDSNKISRMLLEEMLPQPNANKLSASTWIEDVSPATPSPAPPSPSLPSPPPQPRSAPPSPPRRAPRPAGDPLEGSEHSADSELKATLLRPTHRQQWSQPLEDRGFSIDAQREWTHSTITRTQDRIAQTQDRIAQTQERIAQTQDRIAQTQDRIAQSQDRIAQNQDRIVQNQDRIVQNQDSKLSVYDSISNTLQEMAPQIAQIPQLLEEFKKIVKPKDND